MPKGNVIEVSGRMLTVADWKQFQEDCNHPHFEYETIRELNSDVEYAICTRCKWIVYAAIVRGSELTAA